MARTAANPNGHDRTSASGVVYRPTSEEVDDLIARAKDHSLGLEFLQGGALDSVAATFNVHAFVVDEARDQLRGGD